jgi:hypothetical protein
MHHDGGELWTNTEARPELGKDGVRRIIFDVVSVHIAQTGERQWQSLYDARIITER